MSASKSQEKVVRESVGDTIRRPQTRIARMEHRYECSSAEMDEAIATGRVGETAEVSRWLEAYHFLRELNTRGATTGSPYAQYGRPQNE